jgi:hypothetical protein
MSSVQYTPHHIRGGAIVEFARMYKTALAALREAVCNSLDQYEHQDVKEKEKVVTIHIDRLRRTVRIRDYATGITDIPDFLEVGTPNTDPSSGKTVGDQKSSYKDIHPTITGHKHLGKLSYLYASKDSDAEVEFRSNNGKNGHILSMTYDGWIQYEYGLSFRVVDKTEALDERGLEVIIRNAKDDILNIREVKKCLTKWFGIKVARGAKIIVTDVIANKRIEITKPADLKTEGESSHKLLQLSKGQITQIIDPADESKPYNNIDVYHKHYFVTSIHMAYMCKGLVNYNGLELQADREGYRKNQEFEDKLEGFLKTFFRPEPVRENSKPKKADVQRTEEILGATIRKIAEIFPEYTLDLFGFSNNFGIEGKTNRTEKNTFRREVTNDNILTPNGADPNGTRATSPEGNDINGKGKGGTTGQHGTGRRSPNDITEMEAGGPSFLKGGNGQLKTRVQDDSEENSKQRILPKIEWIPKGDKMPTVYVDPPSLVINTGRPGGAVLTVAGKYVHILHDKIIRAVILYLEGKSNSNLTRDEYEAKCDRIWNAMADTK